MTPSKRGDIVFLPFPYTDAVGAKDRPGLVVSSDKYNLSSPMVIVAQITSQLKVKREPGDYRFRRWRESGLRYPSIVRARLMTVHATRIIRKLGAASSEEMELIDRGFHTALGMRAN